MFASVVEMLIKKASQDKRYGQLTRTNRYSNNNIQASTVTHPFEDETLLGPRTKSLPPSRSNQVTRSQMHVAPPQQEQPLVTPPPPQQEQPPVPASSSSDIPVLRRCVLL